MRAPLLLLLLLKLVASQCPLNCLLCLNAPTCSFCHPAFALNLLGGCTSDSIPNCRVYASSSSCQICQSTFSMTGGQC